MAAVRAQSSSTSSRKQPGQHRAAAATRFTPTPVAQALFCLVVGTLAWVSAPSAWAQSAPTAAEARRSFDVPAGSLDQALSRFGRQAGAQIAVNAELTTGLKSPGVSGSHTLSEALRLLLSGTGLQAARDAGGEYTLRKLPAQPPSTTAAPPASSSESTLPEVRVTAESERDATSEGTGSYAARGATLFKGPQSLKDIPQSITVITRQQMDDQGLDTIEQVLANTPGVSVYQRPGGGSTFTSRGFQTAAVEYDGVPLVRSQSTGSSYTASSFYLDRVEVLRGAQGLFEGAGSPGGAINLVRKRGLAERTLKFEGRLGSWDNYGTQLDAGGPLDEDGRVRGRIVLDYENKKSFIDTLHDRNLNAYAALDFDVTPDTTLGVGVAQSNLRGGSLIDTRILRYADGSALNVPRSTYFGADWNDARRLENQLFFDFEHRFNSDWKFKFSGAHIDDKYDSTESRAEGSNYTIGLGARTASGLGYIYDYDANSSGFDANISGRFKTGSISHDVVLGGNYSTQERDDKSVQYSNHTKYDLFNVNHNVTRLDMATPTQTGDTDSETRQKGLYGMLRSHVTDDLSIILGGRLSWYKYDSRAVRIRSGVTTTTPSGMSESKVFTPYAGLVYALTPQWSFYGSYADIFEPQTATDAQLNVLKPIVGTNYEIGIKGEVLDGALNTSVAVFRIDQKNRAVQDDDAPWVCGSGGSSYCSRATGKVRSEGIELEAHGHLTRGWQISGGYTYFRNKYLEDYTKSNIGRPFDYDSPKHMLRLWSDWQLPGEWSKWRFGFGVNVRSEQRTSSTTKLNPVQGGYSVWNARIAYKFNKKWSAALNVENVFDKNYYSSIFNGYNVNTFGIPRSFLLTVRGSF